MSQDEHPPESSQPNQHDLAAALVTLDEAWARLSRQLAAHLKAHYAAVPPGQLLLLQLLDTFGPQRMSDLAAMLGMSQSGATLLVDRAIEAQLVGRTRDVADRRGVWVQIDAQGDAMLDNVRRARAQLLASYLEEVGSEDVQGCIDLFNRITAAALQSVTHDPSSPPQD